MRIGISVSSSLTAESPARALAMMVERAQVAYDAGLSSLSVGDNHAQAKWYAQNTPTLGRLLAQWPDRRAGCLFLVPLWSPVMMAEQIGTLAALVDAPFIIQTGIGGGQRMFDAMGADLGTRGRVTDETIEVVQGLLAGEERSSELLNMGPTRIGLLPTQSLEWWIGGHAPAALDRAARHGAWYTGPGTPIDELAVLADRYRQACDRHGTTPQVIVRRDVLVRPDGAEAQRRADALVAAGYRGMSPDVLVTGGPDEAADHLDRLRAIGCDEVVMRSMSLDQEDALASIEVLADLADDD